MASQVVSAAKRYRISLLLDAYGDLLTEKQRTFLRMYYEEDLSFGEIAKEHGVSRQAIFDSVKHGEESLETFERALSLVTSGWVQWSANGVNPTEIVGRLRAVTDSLRATGASTEAIDELDSITTTLMIDAEVEENETSEAV